MLREVLTQVGLADLLRLLTWFFSTTDNPGAAPPCSVGEVLATVMQPRAEAFADNMTPGLDSSHAPLLAASLVSTSSPALQAHTLPPPALPISNIKAYGTPVGFSSLMLIVGTKPKKCDHSSDDQCNRRAHIRISIGPIDDGGNGSNVNAGSAPHVARCDTTPIKGGRSESPSLISGMPRVIDMIPLPNTAMLAVGTVFYMSSPSPAKEFNPKTAPASVNTSSSIPPLDQPRVMLTLMMLWLQRTLGEWEIEIESPSWV